jgi:hypothetical protein
MSVPLPPLPPVPAVDESDARPGGRSMLDILTDQHREIEDLYTELTGTQDEQQLATRTSVLAAVLSRHVSAEEQYLFPTVAGVLPGGDQLAAAEIGADQAMLRALRTLESGAATDLGGIEQVEAALRRHVRHCEDDLFPRLAAGCSEADLVRLGNRIEIAAEAAPTRPHPATPATPPWNKVVEPAVGVVDKVRDALSGRATRP